MIYSLSQELNSFLNNVSLYSLADQVGIKTGDNYVEYLERFRYNRFESNAHNSSKSMIRIQKNIPLSIFTTFGIGGPADFFLIASTQEMLIESIFYAKKNNLPYFILGTGANIVIGDKGFRGVVIKNETKKVTIQDTLVTAESGTIIADLISQTTALGLSGFEHYAGIPSTVGGALWQNLHFLSNDRTYTEYIGSIVKRARIINEKEEIREVDNAYFQFDYDWSILHAKKETVLDVTFSLTHEDPEIIKKRVESNIHWRNEKHPQDAIKTSAGSVFKKLESYGAGRLIQQVGLTGFQIGGAKVSERHSNFIINTGTATAKDVRELITLIQKTIKDKLGLVLETEISFIGDF